MTINHSLYSSQLFADICANKRSVLKQGIETRKLVLYNKGMEKLDKEIDIVEIVKKFRKLDIIIKYLLQKDQQLLLDLKNTEYISSDEESERYVLGIRKKKIIKKHKLLQQYIGNIKSKELSEADIKLLNILGFGDVVHLLTKPVEFSKINSEWEEVYSGLGRTGSIKKQPSQSPKKFGGSPTRRKTLRRSSTVEKRVRFDSSLEGFDRDPPKHYIYRSKKALERQRMRKNAKFVEDHGGEINDSDVFHELLKSNIDIRRKSSRPSKLIKNKSYDARTFAKNRNLLSVYAKKKMPDLENKAKEMLREYNSTGGIKQINSKEESKSSPNNSQFKNKVELSKISSLNGSDKRLPNQHSMNSSKSNEFELKKKMYDSIEEDSNEQTSNNESDNSSSVEESSRIIKLVPIEGHHSPKNVAKDYRQRLKNYFEHLRDTNNSNVHNFSLNKYQESSMMMKNVDPQPFLAGETDERFRPEDVMDDDDDEASVDKILNISALYDKEDSVSNYQSLRKEYR